MKVDNLEALEQLVKLCRKQGIDKITVDGIVLELGATPARKKNSKKNDEKETEAPPGLTDEELAMWSVNQ